MQEGKIFTRIFFRRALHIIDVFNDIYAEGGGIKNSIQVSAHSYWEMSLIQQQEHGDNWVSMIGLIQMQEDNQSLIFTLTLVLKEDKLQEKPKILLKLNSQECKQTSFILINAKETTKTLLMDS